MREKRVEVTITDDYTGKTMEDVDSYPLAVVFDNDTYIFDVNSANLPDALENITLEDIINNGRIDNTFEANSRVSLEARRRRNARRWADDNGVETANVDDAVAKFRDYAEAEGVNPYAKSTPGDEPVFKTPAQTTRTTTTSGATTTAVGTTTGVTPAVIRQWARTAGFTVPERGRIPQDIIDAYDTAHSADTEGDEVIDSTDVDQDVPKSPDEVIAEMDDLDDDLNPFDDED